MRSEYIEKNKYNNLFQSMQYDNVLAMRVSLETGLRIDDVLSLKPENLDKFCTISCVAKKTGKKAVKKISKSLYTQLLKNCGDFWVFPSPKDKTSHRTRQAVWRDIKKAGAIYGKTSGVSPHSARKTYAVDTLHEKGMNAVQKELQHSRLDTTMLYAFSDLMTGKPRNNVPMDIDFDRFAEIVAEKIISYLKKNLGKRI